MAWTHIVIIVGSLYTVYHGSPYSMTPRNTKQISDILTLCGPVYGVMELGQKWLRQWIVACRHQAITLINAD